MISFHPTSTLQGLPWVSEQRGRARWGGLQEECFYLKSVSLGPGTLPIRISAESGRKQKMRVIILWHLHGCGMDRRARVRAAEVTLRVWLSCLAPVVCSAAPCPPASSPLLASTTPSCLLTSLLFPPHLAAIYVVLRQICHLPAEHPKAVVANQRQACCFLF